MLSGLSGTDIIFLFASLLVSIVLHELMHGVVAYWLGDTTAHDAGRLTLNPLASIDLVTTIIIPFIMIVKFGVPFFAAKPVPFNPNQVRWGDYGAALVGLAGPATNFVLAVIGALVFRLTGGAGLLGTFLLSFTVVNVGIMVFNLIPFPPLDGSRVLYAVAPEPVRRVMEQIEGFGFIAILIFIFVIFQFLSPVVANVQGTILQFLLGQRVY